MDFLVLPLVAAAASALAFLSGFGLGTVLMPVFAIFFPLEVAIAATAVVHLANNLFKLALIGRYADRRVLLAFGIPAVLAAIAGASLLAILAPAEPLTTYELAGRTCSISAPKLVVAAFLAILASLELSPAYQRLALPTSALPIGGILSGFVGGLTGMQGALRAPFLLKAGLDKNAFVGTSTVLSTLVDLTRLAAYAIGLLALARSDDARNAPTPSPKREHSPSSSPPASPAASAPTPHATSPRDHPPQHPHDGRHAPLCSRRRSRRRAHLTPSGPAGRHPSATERARAGSNCRPAV